MAKQGNGGPKSPSGQGKSPVIPEEPKLKTYHEGEPFPGRIGRTWDLSEPAFPVPRKAPPGAPNILYVVLDDVGFGWCDTFGGLVETPSMTRLAKNGLGYINHHTTALCSPTRACLLTGRNHHSVGMANITELATGFPGYNGRQPQDKAAIAAMLHEHGYTSFALGKWHNTPSEETGISGPYNRWPTGPVFGFNRFYGFFGGDSNQWYPKLYLDREPIDQPRLPEHGYHLSEDITNRAISFIANHESVDPEKPWLCYLAFGACHAPHHVAPEWSDKYKGKFDMGWDKYREVVLQRQKKMGTVPPTTELAPMLEGVQAWDGLSADEKRLFARMAEVYAGFLSHADARIGRLIEFLEKTGDLDNTLVFVFIGDNGSSGEGTLNGLFNEMSLAANVPEDPKTTLARIDQLGLPGSYNHYPVGWALAGNTPFRLCKQFTHFGGTQNPLIVHWPKGIKAKGELRRQFHHVIDIVPTILAAIGVEPPGTINGAQQAQLEGVPINYSFDDATAPTNHPTQYFEMLGNRAIVDGNWKAVTYHGRKPWENEAAWSFDEDHWELYDLEKDPSECHDLMAEHNVRDLDDPLSKKLIEMVSLWWAEAGRYNVLPLDDRFAQRSLARAGLADSRTKYRFFPGAIRIPEHVAPDTKNRSWAVDAEVVIPADGATGPLVVMGGDTAGWSLYIKDLKPTFCHNLAAQQLTYIRATKALAPGQHRIRFEFEKKGKEPFGAGGSGRLFVDGQKVGEGEIPRTAAFGYSLDETFDIGCDKGAPVTDEYPPLAAFTGTIIAVDVDLKPDLTRDVQRHTAEKLRSTLLRGVMIPAEQLPSWNEGPTRRSILDFLARVTEDGGPDFVPAEERVAVFDNDGTLWCEKPLPIQADFLLQAVGKMAERDPSLRARQPWKAVVEKDYRWLGGVIDKHYRGDDSDLKLMAAGLLQAYAGSTVEEFEEAAGRFLGTAEHPKLHRPYRQCTFQPMVELLAALEAHGFTNYVVTGGGQDFLRPATLALYHVPPERVIGSAVALEYLDGSKVANLIRKPELGIFDDGAAKPVQIWARTGRRPVFAGGNSNGDIQMLHFCAHPSRPSFALLVHHDDSEREYAYDAGAEESLRRASSEGWTVASLKNDWKTVFAS